jgi:hypothetical protein
MSLATFFAKANSDNFRISGLSDAELLGLGIATLKTEAQTVGRQ